jgi:hypothetical protein
MDGSQSTLERAFELAKSGTVDSMAQLRAKIKAEGYAVAQIDGPTLGRQLRALITKSKADEANRI